MSATEFVVHAVSGFAYLFLKGWMTRSRDGREWDGSVGILVERNADGEVRLVEPIEKCARIFTEACYSFSASGDKFSGLTPELGSIMRKLYGILSRAEEHNEQSSATTV